ncbi:pilus assembly protein TadG-related protein [Paraburkholderia lacunae]|uniref:pilus assembly protein TadG-related protein n=1 Tax=Paraburkholderia lacunae TaxID=2211104 RepID=UPI003CC6C4EB
MAIIVALTLAVLIGFAGLALDLGKLYTAKSELSNAADACALAAARDLTKAVSLATPEAAGISVGGKNRVLLQSENVVLTTNSNVTFSKQFTGPYLTKDQFSAADVPSIGFVRCTVNRANISNWFMQVISATLGTSAVAATAVASTTQSQTTCALPVSVCQPPAASPYTVGQWLASKVGSNNQLTGNFMWVKYYNPDGSLMTVPEIKALLTSAGQCSLPTVGSKVGATGNIQSMDGAWNTRFGIYQNPYNAPPDPSAAVPDFTGYAYSPAAAPYKGAPQLQKNVFPDFRDNRRPGHTPYQGDTASGLSVQGSNSGPQPTSYYTNGADRRLALVPVVDCGALTSSQKSTIQSWACVLMLHPMEKNINQALNGTIYLEYRGDASDPTSPCASQGIPGSTTAGIGPMVPVLVQ